MSTNVASERLATPAAETISARIVRALNRTPIHIFLGIVAVIWLAPTIGLLITSFRPRTDIQSSGWWEVLGTLNFTTENYSQVINAAGMGQSFLNSLLISIPSTLLPLAVCSLAAYAFSWLKFPFRDTIFLVIVALMMVPVQVAFLPLQQLFRPFQLTQGFIGIWLAHTAFAIPFGVFLLRNFFITLPRDLIEAARIDGSSTLGVFRTIVVPLSVPAIAAYGIFQFLWVWNDLLMALIFVGNSANLPMTVKITTLLGTYGTEWHLLAASAFLLMFVPLAVFFSLQRYFVQGLLAGSVK
ncbi:MAG TPA: carbohydrate ABC transporter permease [Candidatus Limnocylindrales bacterium]|jgi:alpha-glucoside transport system permease protein|nr:carbohydrate ABC transporter permease [Candidatus Limnocylindrales bacterium]